MSDKTLAERVAEVMALDAKYWEIISQMSTTVWLDPDLMRIRDNIVDEIKSRASTMVEIIREQAQRIAELEAAASGWRGLDSCPDDGDQFMVKNSVGCCAIVNEVIADDGYFLDDDGNHHRISCITHWMPLPAPPKPESE